MLDIFLVHIQPIWCQILYPIIYPNNNYFLWYYTNSFFCKSYHEGTSISWSCLSNQSNRTLGILSDWTSTRRASYGRKVTHILSNSNRTSCHSEDARVLLKGTMNARKHSPHQPKLLRQGRFGPMECFILCIVLRVIPTCVEVKQLALKEFMRLSHICLLQWLQEKLLEAKTILFLKWNVLKKPN